MTISPKTKFTLYALLTLLLMLAVYFGPLLGLRGQLLFYAPLTGLLPLVAFILLRVFRVVRVNQ